MRSISRSEGVLKIGLLAKSRVGAFGCGRSITSFEMLACSGVEKYLFVDPDIVKIENISQSGHNILDLDLPKVLSCAKRIRSIVDDVGIKTYQCLGEDMPDFARNVRTCSIVKISIDDVYSQFRLADRVQSIGVDTIVAGTSGDNSQNFVAFLQKGGPSLRELLPDAWEGIQAGYQPPAFFPSARVFAEAVNLKSVLAILGVLHHRAGIELPIAQIGAALMQRPLVIGSNGIHGDLFNPARMLGIDEIRGL